MIPKSVDSGPQRPPDAALSPAHRRMLFDESGIDPEIATERGYETVSSRADLLDFKKYQRRAPALRVPLHSPDGTTRLDQIRPDRPRNGGPKYETPGGAELIVDVHPRMLAEVRGGISDLWVTEGARTGDANTSRGEPTVALPGVWAWCVPKAKPYRLRPCWDHIRLERRRVYVAFDSDVITKAEVQLALQALAAALEARGAEIMVVYLPDAPDGTKQGLDDFYAAGGTVKKAKALARKFEPEDIGSIRLSRDEKLRAAIAGLWRCWWGHNWGHMVGTGDQGNSMRGHTARDVMKALIDLATKHGKLGKGGVVVAAAIRTLELAAATSRPSVIKALRNLEADGLIEAVGGRERDKARRYRLLASRATLYQDRRGDKSEGNVTSPLPSYDRRGKGLRASRLRWSSPGRKARRGVDKDTRHVRTNVQPSVAGFKRLGKVRGAVLDALDAAAGSATQHELCEVLQRSRPRDLRRRVLPMLEEAGIVAVDGDTVSLTSDWLARLHDARELGGEIEREELEREGHRRQREAYHRYGETAPDQHYANMGADGYVDDLRGADEPDQAPAQAASLSPLAVAVRDYLDLNASHACEPAGWIALTLWGYELYPGKPTRTEVKAAIEELGGELYLRERLSASRGAA